MDDEHFINEYLHPSCERFDRRFALPLPDGSGLSKTAEFLVQSSCPPSHSVNVIARYENGNSGIRLVEVYKSSQNVDSGKFVRLVGTMSLVKRRYPFLFLDAAVTNIDLQTGGRADLSTRIAVHVPQADAAGRRELMAGITKQAARQGIACRMLDIASLPPFWGPLLSVHRQGIDLNAIAGIRTFAWQAYAAYCSTTAAAENFDYFPVQQQMIIKNSNAEHSQFQRMGLQVPAEVQAAFFSILCTGI